MNRLIACSSEKIKIMSHEKEEGTESSLNAKNQVMYGWEP